MRGIASAAGYLAAVLAIAAGIHTAAGARGRGMTASRIYLTIALCTIALSLAMAAPATRAIAAHIEPVPHTIRLIGDALAMTAAFCVLALTTPTAPSPSTTRARTVFAAAMLIACVATMAVLLLATHTHPTVQFATEHAKNPNALAYQALYVAYMCSGMISFIWLIRQHRLRSRHRLIRWGLRVNMAAAGVGLAWAAWKVTSVAIVAATRHTITDHASVSELLAAMVVGLIATGVTLPDWASWLSARTTRWRIWHTYHALTPLWAILVAEVPQVILPDPLSNVIDYALYRRVIEIRDAQRALRPYIHPNLPTRLAEVISRERLDPVRANLLSEATELASAIHAHRAGHRYQPNTTSIGIPRQHAVADVLSEARWLAHIARTMRSTVVADLAQRTRHTPSAQGCPPR